jgi:hypothetical protein
MPKKEIDPDLVSESEYNDIPLADAINQSMRDLQASLNNIQVALLAIIDVDEISVEAYAPAWELANDLIALTKELKDIVKSFKPKGFKLGLRVADLEKIPQP